MLNWLFGLVQRDWGVTDLNQNAPTSALSPNVSTATGVTAVLSQGNIKFGHLVKRLSETDTKEYDFQHEMWRGMMSLSKTIEVDGQPQEINSKDREKFFREDVSLRARGDGLTTNPTLRDRTLTEAFAMFAQDPFIGGDLEVHLDLLKQILAVKGIKLNLKAPDELKFLQLVSAVMRTPMGQQRLTQALGQSMQEMQAAGAQGGQPGQPGGQPQGGNGVQAVPA